MSLLKSLEIIMIYKIVLYIFCMFFSLSAMAKCDQTIRYHLNDNDGNGKYVIAMLNSIIGTDCLKSIAGNDETEKRSTEEVANGNRDIVWGVYGENFNGLTPVVIDVFKGGFSLRSFLIHADPDTSSQCYGLENKLKNINNLEELVRSNIPFIQGKGWGDTAVLQSNGLKVVTGKYPGLPRMLDGGRGCVYPRGVHEIKADLASFESDDPKNTWKYPSGDKVTLKEYTGIVMSYPNPYFIYVNKDNLVLKDFLEKQIQKSIEDGEFDTFFKSHPVSQAIIEGMNGLGERKYIYLKNPNIQKDIANIMEQNQKFYLFPLKFDWEWNKVNNIAPTGAFLFFKVVFHGVSVE